MSRKLKKIRIIVFILVAMAGLMHNDGNPFPDGRDAHETYLLSLYSDFSAKTDTEAPDYSDGGSFLKQEGPPFEKEYAEGPEYASFRDYLMTMDPATRRVPEKALYRAARQIADGHFSQKLKSGYMFDWEEIPSNTGGRTRAIMYDPNDAQYNKIWAGGVTGGLWYNNDIRGSGTWKAVGDFWPSLAISCITHDPNDSQTYYVGTGEGQTAVIIYRESSGRGSGIWKSSNAGTNWELMESTEGFEYVTDIAIRSESGKSVIYAAVSSGTYKGKVHESSPSEGLFRSTDEGSTWTQVLPDIPGTETPYSPAHIEISASGRIFVGTMRNIDQEGGGRIMYSDDGINWTVNSNYVPIIEARTKNNIPGRVILASAPSDANYIYAIIGGGDRSEANGFVYSRGVMIVKSTNGGQTWTQVTMPSRAGEAEGQWSFLAWHCLTAAVQPDDPNTVWIGGLDLYRSGDGGWTWDQKSLWWNFGYYYTPEYPIYVHADQHSLIFRPGSTTELLNSNDGGVFIATDAKAVNPQFREVNKGYNTLQHYACAIHPEAGKRYFLGGCQDNGTFRTTTTPTSKEVSVSYGDGAYCFIDRDDPRYQVTMSQNNYFYYSSDGNHRYIYRYNVVGGTFINPVDYDDIDNVFYTNGMTFEGEFRDSIFRVRRANDTLLTAEVAYAGTGSMVPFSAMHVYPAKVNNRTLLFAGSQSGKLYRLDNAQSNILSSEIGSQDFPAAYISCIESGEDEDHLLVTFSNYGVPHVWETRDGGNNWTDKSGNLPDIPVRWAIYPPGTTDVAMLATELGVWYTSDITAEPVEWLQCGDPFPNVRVDMLRARESDGYILAGTHGRGLFLSSGAQEVGINPADSPDAKLSVFPNPASDYLQIRMADEGLKGRVDMEIYDLSGKLLRKDSPEKAEFRVRIRDLEEGTYILRVHTAGGEHSKIFIKKE